MYIRPSGCTENTAVKAELVDPHSVLIKYNWQRYAFVSREQIEYEQEPFVDGMVLSVRFENRTVTRTNMTYLSRGLWWTPKYEVVVSDDYGTNTTDFFVSTHRLYSFLAATLRALADIHNDQSRTFVVTSSQLITGTVPLASTSLRGPTAMESHRVEYMASPMSDAAAGSISSTPDATNFGTYSYNITRPFTLLPRSIKTFPFLSTTITLNYTLEATSYLVSGTTSGLFRRVFVLQPADFLPAGTVTFYLAATGLTLGQSRLTDTPKQGQQQISLGTDPDVKYSIATVVTAVRQSPTYGQDLNVTVTISNRKVKQSVSVTLTMNAAYRNTTLVLRSRSSPAITVEQDLGSASLLIIRATVKAEEDETCTFAVMQNN